MNSQNTPVHIKLWHHDFWRMAIANFLLSVSVYLLVPTLPLMLLESAALTPVEVGLVMGVFGLGLFLFGPFVSYLVQRFRRNMVCIFAILLEIGVFATFYSLDQHHALVSDVRLLLLLRFALGAAFGLAQMVLTSTLIIDTSESYQRTEANHSAAWFGRFALSLGPMAGILLMRLWGFDAVLLGAMGCAAAAALLILLVNFPFRTPEDHVPMACLDRFFMPGALPLFLNLLLITTAAGLLMSVILSERFYAMMMAGFLFAILAQQIIFRNAELKSEVVSGLLLFGIALLLMLTRELPVVRLVAPFFVGFGLGIIGARFLLFFIKLSRHCQRGTSQSTFLLCWESGIALGLCLGFAFFTDDAKGALAVALGLVIVALVVYNFVHSWFINHKNR